MGMNYVVTTNAAAEYQAVHAALRDFTLAKKMIEVVLSGEHSELPEFFEEAAWTTAAVRFARGWKMIGYPKTFRSTVLASLSDPQIKSYQHVLTLRDGMYAHHLGIGVDMTVTADVGTDFAGNAKLWGVGIQSSRMSSPGMDAARIFKEVLTVTIEHFAQFETDCHRNTVRDLETRSPEEWTIGGLYLRNLQLDDTGSRYRREFKKRSPGA